MAKSFVPIVTSLLDQDFYKLTILQAMYHQAPSNTARYEFLCRNTPQVPLSSLRPEIERQLDHLCTLRFSEADLAFLEKQSVFKTDFLAFLRNFQFNRSYLQVSTEDKYLQIVAEGPQVQVMMFEIFVLALINELHAKALPKELQHAALANARELLQVKLNSMKRALSDSRQKFPFQMFEFGTRRRFSKAWQKEMLQTLLADAEAATWLKGTSNMELAREFGISPIGTMAHEWLQTFQAMPSVQLRASQQEALECWAKEYRGNLGIALTDVIGMDAFLADFDLYFAKLYDGLRHDSGNPIEWGEKAIAHYLKLGISPTTKRLVFSDGLKFGPSTVELHNRFADRIQSGMGIGTDLTNDTGGIIPALNVVMKLTLCNGQPTAKISDSPGKSMCKNQVFLNYLRQTFGLSPESANTV